MNWKDALAIRFYPPPREPFGASNWGEQILGEIIKPVFDRYQDKIRWLWVTRYAGEYIPDKEPFNDYGYNPPIETIVNIKDGDQEKSYFRNILFRFVASRNSISEICDRLTEQAKSVGCLTSPNGFTSYKVVPDLGSDRFIRNGANKREKTRRAYLAANFVDAYVRVMLDALVKDENGCWDFEINTENPQLTNSSFFVLHHLFCNSTNIPLAVRLHVRDNQLLVVSPHQITPVPGIPRQWITVPIKF